MMAGNWNFMNKVKCIRYNSPLGLKRKGNILISVGTAHPTFTDIVSSGGGTVKDGQGFGFSGKLIAKSGDFCIMM